MYFILCLILALGNVCFSTETTAARRCKSEIILGDLPEPELIGESAPMLELRRVIEQAGKTNANVLITGESGTGKEVVAQLIVLAGNRRRKPFVAENFSAIPDSLVDSILFGHARGAFTGADANTQGLFERADGGTLFMDEVGDMSPGTQRKLLRAIELGHFRKVGGDLVDVDVRLIAATNVKLDNSSTREKAEFRSDLYYRLGVVEILVPPLRSRKSDIPALSQYFLQKYCVKHNFSSKTLTIEAAVALEAYDWPGNVRELAGVMESAAVLSGSADKVELSHLKPRLWPSSSGEMTYGAENIATMDEAVRNHMLRAFVFSKDMAGAAALLDITEVNVRALTLKLKIKRAERTNERRDSSSARPEDLAAEKSSFLTLSQLRRNLILETMKITRGERKAASSLLGVNPSVLGNYIRQLEIRPEEYLMQWPS